MGLFGKRQPVGITQYELDHKHVQSRLDSAFASNSVGRRKREMLHVALKQALDRDAPNDRVGTIQREEFKQIVSDMQTRKLITDQEAKKLLITAEKPLSN